jgi:hypothetical protein
MPSSRVAKGLSLSPNIRLSAAMVPATAPTNDVRAKHRRHIPRQLRIRRRIRRKPHMLQVHERAAHRQVGQGDAVGDQEAGRRDDAFEVGQDRRQFLGLGLVGGGFVAGLAADAGGDQAVEEELRAGGDEDGVASNQMVRARSRGSAGISDGSGWIASR